MRLVGCFPKYRRFLFAGAAGALLSAGFVAGTIDYGRHVLADELEVPVSAVRFVRVAYPYGLRLPVRSLWFEYVMKESDSGYALDCVWLFPDNDNLIGVRMGTLYGWRTRRKYRPAVPPVPTSGQRE